MNISTLRPLALLLILAACVPGSPAPSAGGGTSALPRQASFLGGEMRVVAPPGYCIDTEASHDEAAGAVVLMGRCGTGTEALPALILLTAGAPGSAAVLGSGGKALSDYFTSPAGRAALARDGRAGSVVVTRTGLAGGVFVMRVSDRQAGEYWRGFLGLKGRLVSISVSGVAGAALPEAEGRKLLDRAVAGFVAAN